MSEKRSEILKQRVKEIESEIEHLESAESIGLFEDDLTRLYCRKVSFEYVLPAFEELESENAALKSRLAAIERAAKPIQEAYENLDDDIKQYYQAGLFVVYHAHARDESLDLSLRHIGALIKALEGKQS